jgi:hypothetical protein
MQSSDLDKKGRTHSPSDAKKKHKASDHNVASSPKVSHIHSPEMSLKDVSENGNCTSEIPLTDIPKPSKIPQTNGKINGVPENVPTTTELTPETLPLIDTGSGGADSENNQQVGFLPVLKNPNFLALWAGQVFCQLADKVYLVLMIALINSQFQASDQSISGWVSALMMAFTIPAVLFGSVAGVFVDRWSKKVVLVASNIWRGILVLLIPSLLWLTHDWQPVGVLPVGFLIILGVTFLVSTLTQFFAPAEQSAIPLIVKEQDLLSANSLYTTTMMASVIVGFAVGEPVLALADGLWMQLGGSGGLGKEILVGGSYAIAGLILFLLQPYISSCFGNPIVSLSSTMCFIISTSSSQTLIILLFLAFIWSIDLTIFN